MVMVINSKLLKREEEVFKLNFQGGWEKCMKEQLVW